MTKVPGDTVSDAPASNPLAPATIGRYTVVGTLGFGGMGVVYAAHDPELDRRIAVKLLRGRKTDATSKARIRREAQALARSNHPNVVAVYDVGDHEDGVFIAMELVDGGTLRTWQAKRTWRETLDAYVAAGRGLAAAHARGLVHRDFKPENVLVGTDDHVRVTDFGIAHFEGAIVEPPPASPTGPRAAPSLGSQFTTDGAVMGTIGYMAPEQCYGEPVDARSDQFAWCVSVWEALYGARPFAGTTFEAVAVAYGETPPVIPEKSDVPRSIGHALLRGLAATPADRWPSMAELLDACAPRRRRRRLIAGAVGGVALAGVAIAIVSTRSPTGAVADPCAAGSTRLAGIWDPARRDALARHFGGDPRPDVASVRGLVTRDFDTYASAWSKQWDAACVEPERVADPLLHAQRVNCLESSLVDLHGITDAVLEVDPAVFAGSWKGNLFAVSATPLEDCVKVASIRAMPPAPIAANRAEITRLVVDMHRARVEARTILNNSDEKVRLAGVLKRLDAIVDRLDLLASPVAAEAAWWRASYASEPESLQRAIALARKYRNDRWLALAYGTQIARLDDGEKQKARELLVDLDSAYTRSGGDPRHLAIHAEIEFDDANFDDALAALTALRATGDALDHFAADDSSPEMISILMMRGRADEAIAEARRHVAFSEAMWRGDHWTLADAHEVLAIALAYAGDFAGAMSEARTTLAMHARIRSSPARIQSVRFLAIACAITLGLDSELAALVAAEDALDNQPREEMVKIAGSWGKPLLTWGLANAKPSTDVDDLAAVSALRLGDLATAERYATKSPIHLVPLDDSDRFFVVAAIEARRGHSIAASLAAVDKERQTGDRKHRALATQLEAALLGESGDWKAVRALVEADAFPDIRIGSSGRARFDYLLGRALLETGEPAKAIPQLERSLFLARNLLYSYNNGNYLIADASSALARAKAAITDADAPR